MIFLDGVCTGVCTDKSVCTEVVCTLSSVHTLFVCTGFVCTKSVCTPFKLVCTNCLNISETVLF
jgi:hypothetical protein